MAFLTFSSVQNHDFYRKTNSLERFRLFRQSMNNLWFRHTFWHHFVILRAYFSFLFRHRVLRKFQKTFFLTFGSIWDRLKPFFHFFIEKGSQMAIQFHSVRSTFHSVGRPKTLKTASAKQPRIFIDFGSILGVILMIFWSLWPPKVSWFSVDFGSMLKKIWLFPPTVFHKNCRSPKAMWASSQYQTKIPQPSVDQRLRILPHRSTLH